MITLEFRVQVEVDYDDEGNLKESIQVENKIQDDIQARLEGAQDDSVTIDGVEYAIDDWTVEAT